MGLAQGSERKRTFNDIGVSGHISDSLALIASMRISPGPLGKSADPRSVTRHSVQLCAFVLYIQSCAATPANKPRPTDTCIRCTSL